MEVILAIFTIIGGIAAVLYFWDFFKKIIWPSPTPSLVEPPTSAVPSCLHQLPADIPDFTGREDEIRRLIKELTSGLPVAAITALGGMGGVGKTILAVHVARQLTNHYPEGQIVVNLRGTSPSPLSSAAAMAQVIHAFHPMAPIPENESEVTGFYRSVLHGRRVLILLDNAAHSQQVAPLLPAPPSGALITSRHTLVIPGVTPLYLDVLPPDQACQLLETVMGLTRATIEELKQLASLCGFLPLALRAAGSFLKRSHHWTVAQYLLEITDTRKRLQLLKVENLDVEAVLGLSAARLAKEKPQLAARWQMLSVFPADFGLDSAAAVWEAPVAESQGDLGELRAESLILYDSETRRWRLHDLMRLVAGRAFSYGLVPADEAANRDRLYQASALHAAFFARLLGSAEEQFLQGGQALIQGLALFDQEWENIRAGQIWAAAQGKDVDQYSSLVSTYPLGGIHLLRLRLPPRCRISWLEAGLSVAERLQDRTTMGRHLGNLGNAYHELGDFHKAIECHEQQLAISRDMGDRRHECIAMCNLGIAYADMGDYRRAIDYQEQSLAITKDLGDRRGEGDNLGNLGNDYCALGEHRRAIGYYEQHLAIAKDIGDRQGEGSALSNLGLTYNYMRDYRRGIDYLEKALAIFKDLGDRRGEGIALGNLGMAYEGLGDYRQAIDHHEKKLAIAKDIGDRLGEGIALGGLGIAYHGLGNYRRAIDYYEQALLIAKGIGDRLGEGLALFNKGEALYRMGERDQAMALAKSALKIFEEIEYQNVEMVRQQLDEWGREG